ncbi:MAG: Rrf2 family transcriptional regulator [Clostridia bacterium]|nr:Rrf2 family transcriptional regulator [Clostridia bacterium]
MKITRECDYAIRITLMLSGLKDGAIADAGTISEAQCVPKQFTLKILRELMAAGYVKSFKGARGGYCMNASPENLTLLDIITAIDGKIAVNECLECNHSCNRVTNMADCPVHRQMYTLNTMITDTLSNVTFAKLLSDC